MGHTRLLVLLAALVALSATACGTPSEGAAEQASVEQTAESSMSSRPTRTDSPAPSASTPAPVVPEELEFTAETINGEPIEGTDLAGRPAVLWFWAPWCPNCQREAPGVARTAAAAEGVTFVGVAARDDVSAMREFVSDYGLDGFDHIADVDAAVWRRFRVTYQPAYAFISADGSVEVVRGGLEESELTERVEEL